MQTQNLGGNFGDIVGGGIGDIFNVIGAVQEYRNAQEQGDNGAVALTKSLINFGWGEFYYGSVQRILSEGKFLPGVEIPSIIDTIANKGIKEVPKTFKDNFRLRGVGSYSLGNVASAAGSFVGRNVAGLGGGIAGAIGGVIPSAFGVKGAIKGGFTGGLKLGRGVGNIVGGFAGGMALNMLVGSAPQLLTQLPRQWEHTADVMTNAYRQRGKLGSGYFEMSQAGYTMRQRSLNAIRQNGLNTQSVLGNEARTYFRGAGLDY